MIFDAPKVSALITSYKASRDQETLEAILKESTPLVKAVVVSFGFTFSNGDGRALAVRAGITGNDIIQECLAKIAKAVWYYDSDISNPYNYFTSIIRNACKDALGKVSDEERAIDDCEIEDVPLYTVDTYSDGSILIAMRERNRARFPSIATDVLDDITEHVYLQAMRWDREPRRLDLIAKDVTRIYTDISKADAMALCSSTYVYMRLLYMENVNISVSTEDSVEYTLLPELKMLLGAKAYSTFMVVFSGMEIKIP